uniref:Transcription factor AP-1 n=1 Tax=Cacopsylla melanoneura TaxID=428564 RepID=A0A8D8RHG2_9HEMI
MDNANFFNSNSTANKNQQDSNNSQQQQLVPTSLNNLSGVKLINLNPLKRNESSFTTNMDGSSSSNQNSNKPPTKRPKLLLPNMNIPISLDNLSALSSPDLNKLKVSTPELERFIMQNINSLQTPTPTQVLFSTNIMEEQEHYTKGFADAMNNASNSFNTSGMLKSENSEDTFDMTRCSSNSSSATYTTLDSSNPFPTNSNSFVNSTGFEFSSDGSLHIKEEPSTAHSIASQSPPLSPITPIDMESQERAKLERKRQRNRVAASKCRKRKLERIAKLEDKVKLLKSENTELASMATKLKQQGCSLKEQSISMSLLSLKKDNLTINGTNHLPKTGQTNQWYDTPYYCP